MLTWVAVLCHLSEPGYMEGDLCPWSTSSRSKCTRQVGTVHSWTVSMIILSPGDKLKTKLPPVHQTLQFCPTYPFKHGNYMKASITLKTGHVDHQSCHCWSLITSLLTVDPLTVDCWLSITSLLTVDPLTVDCWSSPPGSTANSVDHQSPHCWPLTVDHLTVDYWLSITSLLTIDPLTVDCWSLIHPWSTVDCWSLIHPWLTINTVNCWSGGDQQSTWKGSTVNCDFKMKNISVISCMLLSKMFPVTTILSWH